ncbi:MAG: hypothetical protein FWC16_14340 [Defluviitaleaceae bacterium]|nr:hypothetical protein [Defluviitaleaceae bacterium]MCL2276093.1 hypothetical protein [Defluviitaleaceae bacterium]
MNDLTNRIKKQTMEKIHNQSGKKPRVPSYGYASRAAAFIAVFFMATSLTVFAAYSFGGFAGLRSIIGEPRADLLSPLEITPLANITEESGFRAEVIAVGVFNNMLDLYITLEDTVSNRLEGPFDLEASIRCGEGHMISPAIFSQRHLQHFYGEGTQSNSIVHRTPCGIVTLRASHMLREPITNGGIAFHLDAIHYNFSRHEVDLTFALAYAQEQAPAYTGAFMPLLTPHMHNIPVQLATHPYMSMHYISGIGFIDGRLHIQEYFPRDQIPSMMNRLNVYNNYTGQWFWPAVLWGDCGDVSTSQVAHLLFSVDEQGNIDVGRHGNFQERSFHFYPIPMENYRLTATFLDYDTTPINWVVPFDLDMPEVNEIILTNLNLFVPRANAYVNEMRISPFGISVSWLPIEAPQDSRIFMSAAGAVDIRITPYNARPIVVSSRSAAVISETREEIWFYEMPEPIFDFSIIASLTIGGVLVELP